MRVPIFLLLCVTAAAAPASGQDGYPARPLSLADVLTLAAERRPEIDAARARVRAAEARPAIAGALEDPMVAASIDHLPFGFDGADVSLTIEQRFPLSPVRRHRRDAALADLDRVRAGLALAALDARAEAASAFLMVWERRRTRELLDRQIASARDVVTAANARYAAAVAPQADVLMAEVEAARLTSARAAVDRRIRAAEVMLNTALALPVSAAVPPLVLTGVPPLPAAVAGRLASARPELGAARAAVRRADADIAVMKDMFRPMATVRTGPSYTMAAGSGLMVMAGVTIPLRRSALRAGVAEAEAMRAMAVAEADAMTRMVEGEAAAAVHEADAARVLVLAMRDDVLPRARAAVAPALSGYTAGQLPLASVIAAVQAVWDIEQELIEAEAAAGLAAIRAARAAGTFEGVPR